MNLKDRRVGGAAEVECSETHRANVAEHMVGFAALYPPYDSLSITFIWMIH
jgi:hypothetical protein